MSYPVQPPPITTAPPVSPAGRPPAVTFAAALLWLMAGVGLIYAIATVAIVPGTVSRFRDVTAAPASRSFTGGSDPEYYVAVIWLGAAIALAVAVIAFALFVVVGLSLRRGSNAARIATLVVSVLGILAGTAAVLILAAQRSGNSAPWSLGAQLSDAYPDGWIGANAGLSIAQILGYALVGILILTAPRTFFRRPAAPSAPQPAYGAAYPGYGVPANAGHPGHPAPGSPPPSPAVSGYAPGGFAASGSQSAGYPAPGNYPAGFPAYGSQPGGAYPQAPGYGPAAQPAPHPDQSPYARPADHAPDATFATPPAQPSYPPADPHSPYARPTSSSSEWPPSADQQPSSSHFPAPAQPSSPVPPSSPTLPSSLVPPTGSEQAPAAAQQSPQTGTEQPTPLTPNEQPPTSSPNHHPTSDQS